MTEILDIVEIGNPVLRQPTTPLSKEELLMPETQNFIDNLVATMRAAKGAGIAANQVGRSASICVIEVNENPRYPYRPKIPLTILVNPTFSPVSNSVFENYEGCLSVPNLRGLVKRYCEIDFSASNRNGNPIEGRVRGMTAATYQHEIDHLNGMVFLDRVTDSKSIVTWKNFEKYHQETVAENVRKLVSHYGS